VLFVKCKTCIEVIALYGTNEMVCPSLCECKGETDTEIEQVVYEQMILWNTRRGFGPRPYLHRKPSSKK